MDSDNELIWVNACHFSPAASFGKTGIEQLAGQTARLLNGQPLEKSQRELQLAFNLLPQNGAIGEDGYTSQESRLISQTKRLLDNPDLQINATAIQAPTFYGQAQSIEIGFAYPVDIGAVERLLKQAKDIRLVKPAQSSPAVYSRDGNGEQLFISRLRQNCGNERALTLWCVADSLRHSAAVRAVQIAEMLIKSYL